MPSKPLTQRYAVGLYRVSTAEQGQSGLGLEAQQASVRAFAAAQGWTLVAEFSDVASGKDDHRPGFQAALSRCRQLGAVLAAARLDRITRRTHTLLRLLDDGYPVRAADVPGPDNLRTRIYSAHCTARARADYRTHGRRCREQDERGGAGVLLARQPVGERLCGKVQW